MKKPRHAPTMWDVMQEIGSLGTEQMGELLALQDSVASSRRYLHWDEILRREPPAKLSHRQWWFLLKLGRMSLKQSVPLCEKEGTPFSYVLAPPIPEQLHQIDLRLGGQIKMPEEVTNPETKDEYYVSSLFEEAITSSQLEGATTTRRIAREMLRSGRPPHDRSERMILNNYLTMRRIGELKTRPLDKELILEIHRLVTHDTLDDPTAAGRFRTNAEAEQIAVYDNDRNRIMHHPPPASVLDERLPAICEFANQTEPWVHPVVRSIILHFIVGYDHPFVDGNGRTARALFYWSMLHHKYWLAEYISISQIVLRAPARYARAFLYTETDEADLTYFLIDQLSVIMRALESLHQYIARKTSEIQTLEKELRGIEVLNHRQRSLIRHAIRHPGKRYTVAEHQRTNDVSYESARSDLLNLVERGLLNSMMMGVKWIFTPVAHLTRQLAARGTSRQTLH
jgi:Fic family protein